MRAPANLRQTAKKMAVLSVTALALCSCSSSSHLAASSTTSGATTEGADSCTLVTAAELSQAVGVQYTAVQGSDGSFCNVTGANVTDSFFFIVDKQGAPPNTWDSQIAIVKRDD